MKLLAALSLLALAACATTREPATSFAQAQSLVEEVAAKHPELVRLTLHAVPNRQSQCRVIASNVPSKLDDLSDPEDVQAMRTKKPVTLQEGGNLDYTAPVVDSTGTAVAAVGVTVMGPSQSAMLASAKAIAAELSAAVLAADAPLW